MEMADRNHLGRGFNSRTLHEEEEFDDKYGEEEEDAQLFLAVVEKHGPCVLQIKVASDGTPFLVATPTAECASQVQQTIINSPHLHEMSPPVAAWLIFSTNVIIDTFFFRFFVMV
jgi:hypothetical protein